MLMPERPNGGEMPDGQGQTPLGESQDGRRLRQQRVMPRSPKEALQPDAAPPPPHPPRRRRTLSAFSGFLTFLLLAAIGSMVGLVWGEHRLREPGPLAASKVIYIAPGTEV